MGIQAQLQQQKDACLAYVLQAWENKLAPHYHALQVSEQRLLLFAAVLLPLLLLIFVIIVPMAKKNTQLQDDVVNMSNQLLEAQQLAALIQTRPSTGQGADSNKLLTLVDQLARESGVRSFMTRLRPQQVMGQQGRLQAQMKDVPYAKLVVFLAALAKKNLTVAQIKIQAASPSMVHVQAVIGG